MHRWRKWRCCLQSGTITSLPVVFAQTAESGCLQCSQVSRSREMSVHARGEAKETAPPPTSGLDRQELGVPRASSQIPQLQTALTQSSSPVSLTVNTPDDRVRLKAGMIPHVTVSPQMFFHKPSKNVLPSCAQFPNVKLKNFLAITNLQYCIRHLFSFY